MTFESYNLFRRQGPRICWVQTNGSLGNHGRKDKDDSTPINSFGALSIRNEMQYQYDIVTIEKIHNYDFALFSITSVVEIENIIRLVCKYKIDKGKCKVIAGGMGCINIWPIIDFVDVAVFGRAEGQINDIIDGAQFSNVWRKDRDPRLEGEYEIRQALCLLPGEAGIGCPNKCAYCQYTHVRRFYKSESHGYRAADISNVYEDDWNRIQLRQGRNQTAWDGLSQDTRFRVHKAVSDKAIIDKIADLRERNYKKAANIKIFQIVGYTWETPGSIGFDIDNIGDLLAKADGKTGGRILIMFCVTPLSPEPLTPLQSDNVEFHDWRKIIKEHKYKTGRERQVYVGDKIEAFILPQISGVYTLQKRIALNRCDAKNKSLVNDFVTSGEAISEHDFYTRLSCEWRGQTDYLRIPK